MAEGHAPGLTQNQKRARRRHNLDARLALARRDAGGYDSAETASIPAPGQARTQAPAPRQEPTQAPAPRQKRGGSPAPAQASGGSTGRAPAARTQPKAQAGGSSSAGLHAAGGLAGSELARIKKEVKTEDKAVVKSEPKSEDEESLPGALAKGKPSRAAHLTPLEGRGETYHIDSDEDVHSSLDPHGHMGEDVASSSGRESSRGPSREPSRSATERLEKGRGDRGRGAVRLRPRRTAESSQHSGQAGGQGAAPPWRREGNLRGIKRVLPRHEVERDLERELNRARPLDVLPFPAVEMSREGRHLSRASTQLLRWGRADVDTEHEGRRTLWLPNWAPDAWFSRDDIARGMCVRRDQLPDAVLLSQGSHGPRVVCRELHGRMEFKANWTVEQRSGGGQRGGQRGFWNRSRGGR